MNRLEVRALGLRFGGVTALSDVGFDVRAGDVHALIGPNGAGKSSLLNCISGVYRPQQGAIALDGRPIHRRQPHEVAALGVARTFQHLALFKGMSVLDNVMAGRNLHMRAPLLLQCLGRGPAAAEERAHRAEARRIIDFLDIGRWCDTRVAELPYGLQKRVDLARALAMQPRLLLLDEPMAGMNPEDKRTMCRYILAARDTFGTTVVLIEHDMGVVMDLSDRLVVLDHGRTIGEGTPAEVRANEQVVRAYLGTAAADEVLH